MKNAHRTLTEEMTVDQDDLPDEMDLASADYNQNLSFRLRGRERHLLSKIEEALERDVNVESLRHLSQLLRLSSPPDHSSSVRRNASTFGSSTCSSTFERIASDTRDGSSWRR